MQKRKLKLLLIGAGIVACIGFLLAVTLSGKGGLVYYYTVSEFKQMGSAADKSFRINGKVADGSVAKAPNGLDVRFSVTDGKTALPVEYHGVVPDTFVDGADVVIEGALGTDGTFQASTLLAKCPSKYEAKAKTGEQSPHEDSRAEPYRQ